MNKNNFEESIKVKRNFEKERILKLQKDYQQGKINAYDISDEDVQMLLKVYDIINAELEQKIKQNAEKEKRYIVDMLKRKKNSKN